MDSAARALIFGDAALRGAVDEPSTGRKVTKSKKLAFATPTLCTYFARICAPVFLLSSSWQHSIASRERFHGYSSTFSGN